MRSARHVGQMEETRNT